MRIDFNGEIVEVSLSMIEVGMFIFGVYLITFFGVLTAVIVSRGVV
jgi:hypothetical protein